MLYVRFALSLCNVNDDIWRHWLCRPYGALSPVYRSLNNVRRPVPRLLLSGANYWVHGFRLRQQSDASSHLLGWTLNKQFFVASWNSLEFCMPLAYGRFFNTLQCFSGAYYRIWKSFLRNMDQIGVWLISIKSNPIVKTNEIGLEINPQMKSLKSPRDRSIARR